MAARGLDRRARLELLDRAYAALTSKFAARRPEEQAYTWYSPDQRVGFWIRRMAQETVIHRVDAELADGELLAAIPADLAADGIDELLIPLCNTARQTGPRSSLSWSRRQATAQSAWLRRSGHGCSA